MSTHNCLSTKVVNKTHHQTLLAVAEVLADPAILLEAALLVVLLLLALLAALADQTTVEARVGMFLVGLAPEGCPSIGWVLWT